MEVAKGFPCLCRFFAIPNVRKLVIRQVERNDWHCLLHTPFVLFFHFWIIVRKWYSLGFVHNTLKIHKANPISNLNIQRLKFSPLNFVNDSNTFILKWHHFMLKAWGYTLYNLKSTFMKFLYAFNGFTTLNQLLLSQKTPCTSIHSNKIVFLLNHSSWILLHLNDPSNIQSTQFRLFCFSISLCTLNPLKLDVFKL